MAPSDQTRGADSRPLVIIADDTADETEVYSTYLRQIGYTVKQAEHRRAARDLIKQQLPDVLIIEITPRATDSIDLCRWFRGRLDTLAATVLAITALPEQHVSVRQVRRAGADRLVFKPCPPSTLFTHMQAEALQRRSRILRGRAATQVARSGLLLDKGLRLLEQRRAVAAIESDARSRTDPSQLIQRARADYLDLPGLTLSVAEAARLWNADHHTCRCVLDLLVRERLVVRLPGSRFARSFDR